MRKPTRSSNRKAHRNVLLESPVLAIHPAFTLPIRPRIADADAIADAVSADAVSETCDTGPTKNRA